MFYLAIPYLLLILILYLAEFPLAVVIGIPTLLVAGFVLHPWLQEHFAGYKRFSERAEDVAPTIGTFLIISMMALGFVHACSDGREGRCTAAEARFNIC